MQYPFYNAKNAGLLTVQDSLSSSCTCHDSPWMPSACQTCDETAEERQVKHQSHEEKPESNNSLAHSRVISGILSIHCSPGEATTHGIWTEPCSWA